MDKKTEKLELTPEQMARVTGGLGEETLGFVCGCPVSIVNTFGGNIIVNIKDTRVAVSREMAQKIMLSDDG